MKASIINLACSKSSAKVNERMWRASEGVIDYHLSITSHLDRCNYEKQIQQAKTCQCYRYFQVPIEITSVKTDDGRFLLDEADMTIVNCASLVRV